MKFCSLFLVALCQPLLAIPNSVLGPFANAPSPLNGQELTGPLIAGLRSGVGAGELPGDWKEEASVAQTRSAYLQAQPKVLGQEALLVRGLWRDEKLEEVQVTFNDAGSYFGYYQGELTGSLEEKRAKFLARQKQFDSLHEESLEMARESLEKLAGEGDEVRFGKSRSIRAEVLDYEWEGVTARLFHGENRLVRVVFRRTGEFGKTWMDRDVAEMKGRDYTRWLADRLEKNEAGDEVLAEMEIVPQGYRPYCGLNTLVMAGRYLGLHIDEDWLASAAKFQNTGSAAGSQMLSLYGSVASEAGVKMKRFNKFDATQVKRGLRSGCPVVVWRRWSQERDRLHSKVTREFEQKKEGVWGELSKDAWPGEKAPLHASVVVGFNEKRNEFLIMESWKGLETPRRISAQELAYTSYLTFCFQPQ